MSLAILTVALLLAGGVALRQRFAFFRILFIPASVIAGFLGLGVLSLLAGAASWYSDRGGDAVVAWVGGVNETLAGWPGPLIAVVFAAMMLQQPAGSPRPRDESGARRVGRQGLMVWIIVLGETMVGLLATGLLIQPLYDVPNSFGMLIETGFAGGHGTAAAMGQVFASPQVNLPSGLDLGLLMATCGLVYGVVSGILWINLASRWGWIPTETADASEHADEYANAKESLERERGGNPEVHDPRGDSRGDPLGPPAPETLHPPEPKRKPIGFQTMAPEVIDPLLLQIIWISLAVGLGMAMQAVVMGLAGQIDAWMGMGAVEGKQAAEAELSKRLAASNVMDFPLFIYTLFGGWALRRVLRATGQSALVDAATIQRLSSTAMEILVVAAITSLRLSEVVELLVPFAILFGCGAIWTAVCLMAISRHVLPREHWFPLALINYGMSTGTTATGFVLLRVVDPELKTGAASDYALAAPLSAPFIGGGILTIALPLVALERVSILWPTMIIAAVVLVLVIVGVRLGRRSVVDDAGASR